jgi:hypothetical protein
MVVMIALRSGIVPSILAIASGRLPRAK